jgi:uncharacterized protein YjbI with pentapeptide repeats
VNAVFGAGSDLSGVDARETRATTFQITGSTLTNAYFYFADLRYASFTSSAMTGTRFGDATLHGSAFTDDDLTNAEFYSSDLERVEFNGATLVNAKFAGAKFPLTAFIDSDLTGASFAGDADLSTTLWVNTICPDGTNSDSHGSTCVGHL